MPTVNTMSFVRILASGLTGSSSRSPGAPTAGVIAAAEHASVPTKTPVAKLWSVISVTIELPPAASSTLPISPAPLTTGSPRCTPSLVPLLIVTRWYQLLGECANTRASTGPYLLRPPLVSMSLSLAI